MRLRRFRSCTTLCELCICKMYVNSFFKGCHVFRFIELLKGSFYQCIAKTFGSDYSERRIDGLYQTNKHTPTYIHKKTSVLDLTEDYTILRLVLTRKFSFISDIKTFPVSIQKNRTTKRFGLGFFCSIEKVPVGFILTILVCM